MNLTNFHCFYPNDRGLLHILYPYDEHVGEEERTRREGRKLQ